MHDGHDQDSSIIISIKTGLELHAFKTGPPTPQRLLLLFYFLYFQFSKCTLSLNMCAIFFMMQHFTFSVGMNGALSRCVLILWGRQKGAENAKNESACYFCHNAAFTIFSVCENGALWHSVSVLTRFQFVFNAAFMTLIMVLLQFRRNFTLKDLRHIATIWRKAKMCSRMQSW